MQLTHYTSRFQSKSFPITIICDGLNSPFNIGGIFRVADAFGVEQIVFLNMTDGLGKRFKKTSRSAEKYVPYLISDNFEAIYGDLKKRHYQFLALEITHQSLPLNEFKLAKDQPVALIVGGENMGISDSILNEVDTHLHISMYGVNSSMNVVQSAAIALYEISTQLK